MPESSRRGLTEAGAHHQAGQPIIVTTAIELKEALVETHAGRRIVVRAGTYAVDVPLTVPEGAALEGEGEMLGPGLPAGFAPESRTRIVALPVIQGDLLTLRNNASIRGLVIEDIPRPVDGARLGNTIAVVSTGKHSSTSASIVECEVVNPNPTRPAGPEGPNGGAIAALTLNIGFDQPPDPHEGALVKVVIRRSIVRAAGRALFAMNFATDAKVEVELTKNVVAGTIDAIGGISRPDAVIRAQTTIVTQGNLYLPTLPTGWIIVGGSSPPFRNPPPAATSSNEVDVDSRDDRIEGFGTAIEAYAGRRLNDVAGLSSDNQATLKLRGLTIQTTDPKAADFRLIAAASFPPSFSPGDRNTLSVDIRHSIGSDPPENDYKHALPENFGQGNRLKFKGTPAAFAASTTGIPTPAPTFF
jgi:hypothetical protein